MVGVSVAGLEELECLHGDQADKRVSLAFARQLAAALQATANELFPVRDSEHCSMADGFIEETQAAQIRVNERLARSVA